MGALLEAVATAVPGPRDRPSSVRLATQAARTALKRGGRRPDDVALLVNAGVFRDQHIIEPANAAFIQHQVGANLEWGSVSGASTLSFDLVNGVCGTLSAVQVVDNFVALGSAGHALVVASDVDPDPEFSQGYPYLPMGGALLLGPGPDDQGFQAFDSHTYAEYADLAAADLVVVDPGRPAYGQALRLHEDPAYPARALECAADAVVRFLDKQGRDPAELDLVIGWPFARELPGALHERAGLERAQILDLAVRPALPAQPVHTAGIAMALEEASHTARYRNARLVLLLAVGAGITVTTALYRKEAGVL